MPGIFVKPGFHYTANATTTTHKQCDYKVEQSSFTLIALFLLKIGRCRLDNECYASLAVLLTQVQCCSLFCSCRLLPMYDNQAQSLVLICRKNPPFR